VSAMTASRSLRNDPKVLPKTRERVLAAAAKLGYRPDPLLSSLSARRRGRRPPAEDCVIPYITNWLERDAWRAVPHFAAQFAGAKRRAEELGYRLDHFWLRENGLSPARFSQIMYHRGIRSVLIAPVQAAAGHIRLSWDLFAAVKFGYSLRYPALHYIADHQFYSMRLVCRELAHVGYRRLGLFIEEASDKRSMGQWSAAFFHDQLRLPAAERVPPLLTRDSIPRSREIFVEWLETHRPDVVISVDNVVGEWIREAGFELPQEIGFANLDLPDPSGTLAGIYQNPELAGSEAVDLVHRLMQRHEYGIPTQARAVLTHGTWVSGSSVRAPKSDR